MITNNLKSFLLIFLALSTSFYANSIEGYSIKSKSFSLSELESTLLYVYKGNVVVQSADINIKGDMIERHEFKATKKDQKFIITGTPAIVDLVNEEGETITVKANHIIYDLETQFITSTENAHISMGQNYSKGHKVTYHTSGFPITCESDENSQCESFTASAQNNN